MMYIQFHIVQAQLSRSYSKRFKHIEEKYFMHQAIHI